MGLVEGGGVAADMHQGREHGREVGAVGSHGRAGDGEARSPQRRVGVGPQAVIEAPVEHGPPQGMHFGKTLRLVEGAQRGLRHHQFAADLDPFAFGVARHDRGAATIEQLYRPAAMVEDERLLLDLRLEREGAGTARRGQACRDLV